MLRNYPVCSAVVAAAAVLLATLNLVRAEDESSAKQKGSQTAPIGELRREVDAVRRDLKEIRAALKRVEEAVEKQQSPGFSPVTIRIQSEDGRPLAGYLVEMESAHEQGQRAFASGRSDRSGVALSRKLPYGDYDLKISGESGWTTRLQDVAVEIGTSFEKVVVAPDPQERATLRIQSAIDPEHLDGLRFGELRKQESPIHYSSPFSPEPGEESERYADFPTPGEGITQVAAAIEVAVEQSLEQPDGKVQTWRWTPGEKQLPAEIFASSDEVLVVSDVDGASARPKGSSRFFSFRDARKGLVEVEVELEESEPEEMEHPQADFSIGYLRVDVRRVAETGLSLQIVPGELTLSVERMVGKPGPQVLKSLGLENDANIWLEASLRGDSEWVPRLLDLTDWQRGSSISYLAKKTAAVAPDETIRITVNSPEDLPNGADSDEN